MATASQIDGQHSIGAVGGTIDAVVICLSSPGIVAFILCLVAEISLTLFRHHDIPGMNPAVLQGNADIFRFFGLLTHPAALILVAICSLLPIKTRAKRIMWFCAVSGVLGWIISGWMISNS